VSILVRFAPEAVTTTEQYDEVIRRLQDSGGFPWKAWSTTCASSWTGTSESATAPKAEGVHPVTASEMPTASTA
jgi:hypothetical protein